MELIKKLKSLDIVYISEEMYNYNEYTNLGNSTNEMELSNHNQVLDILNKYFNSVTYYSSPKLFAENINKHKNSIIFPNWFGRNFRNRKGYIPAICESSSIKYIGADAHTHIISSDKYVSKLYAKEYGINSSDCVLINYNDNQSDYILEKISTLDLPIIVKPNFEGNSVGVDKHSVFYNYSKASEFILSLQNDIKESIIVEEYMMGHEIKVFLFGNNSCFHIIDEQKLVIGNNDYFKTEVFGLEEKVDYSKHINVSSTFLDQNTKNKFKKIFNSFKKVEYLRIDGRYDNDEFKLIELTPDCCIEQDSGFGDLFRWRGYTYEDAILSLVLNSLFPEEYQMTNRL